MSQQTYSQPTSVRASKPPRRSVAMIVVGWILIVTGLFAGIGAGALVLFSGSSLRSGQEPITTRTPALVVDTQSINSPSAASPFGSTPNLLIDSATSGNVPTFIGIGRTSDVDNYLAGVARDQVSDIEFSPYRLNATPRPGADKAANPGDQTFWVATLRGGASQLSWPVAGGDYSVVIMNADGSAGVNTKASFGVTVPALSNGWTAALFGGVALLTIGGIVLVVVGSQRRVEHL